MIKQLKSVVVLTAICVVVSLLMAVTNELTADVIRKNEDAAANEALLVVMPNGEGFEKLDLSEYSLPSSVEEAYKEKNGGYVVKVVTSGYGSGLTIMCGIDKEGKVTGAVCLATNETLGAEKTYGNKFKDATLETVDGIDVVGGATLTSNGYKNAVKDALKSFVVFGGGDVDLRSDEEKLMDNLTNALPSGEKQFEEIFVTEKLDGVQYVYAANNGTGFVYVIGESFVGVDNDGNVVGEVEDSLKTTALAAHAVMSASEKTEIDISNLGLPSNILKVYKTLSGNYVFELRAAGFGINGDEWYQPSGEYIYISLCATSDKEIISIKTTSQAETNGLGAACGNKDFYEQFIGKNDSNYKEIDGISGATLTTNGYKVAVGRALEAITILEGVN